MNKGMQSRKKGKKITNSYHPKAETDKSGSGIGLEQVSKRLELIYPGRYQWQRGTSKDKKEYSSKLVIKVVMSEYH